MTRRFTISLPTSIPPPLPRRSTIRAGGLDAVDPAEVIRQPVRIPKQRGRDWLLVIEKVEVKVAAFHLGGKDGKRQASFRQPAFPAELLFQGCEQQGGEHSHLFWTQITSRWIGKRWGGCYHHGVSGRLPGTLFVRNLIQRRSLVIQLVKRDFQQRYVGSAAGWLWGIVHPLVQLAALTFMFSYCLGQKLEEGEVTTNYPLFLFAGLLPWNLFAETLQRSSSSLVEQANLLTKTVFPAEIVPISVFLSSLVSHVLAVFLLLAATVAMLGEFHVTVILLPAFVLLGGMLAVGLGWIAAALQVYLRDTSQVVAVGLTFWFWLTPIFVREKQIPTGVRFLLIYNPMTYIVRAYRNILLGGIWPSWQDWAMLTTFSILVFVFGGLFFRYMKRGFADVL